MEVFKENDQLLLPSSSRMDYASGANYAYMHNIAIGQYKLLISELQFLTYFTNGEGLIIYAGSSPGHHLQSLFKLFPHFTWHLYDIRKFRVDNYDRKKVKYFQQYFTNEEANYYRTNYRKKALYFISDIRNIGLEIYRDVYQSLIEEFTNLNIHLTFTDKGDLIKTRDIYNDEQQKLMKKLHAIVEQKIDQGVLDDMQTQKQWLNIMRPTVAQLKFRLPYNSIRYPLISYFNGKCFWGIFSKNRSSETRLVVDNYDVEVLWDTKKYDDQLYYHNLHRNTKYKVNGVTYNTYDEAAEQYLIIKYINKFQHYSWFNVHNDAQQLIEILHEDFS